MEPLPGFDRDDVREPAHRPHDLFAENGVRPPARTSGARDRQPPAPAWPGPPPPPAPGAVPGTPASTVPVAPVVPGAHARTRPLAEPEVDLLDVAATVTERRPRERPTLPGWWPHTPEARWAAARWAAALACLVAFLVVPSLIRSEPAPRPAPLATKDVVLDGASGGPTSVRLPGRRDGENPDLVLGEDLSETSDLSVPDVTAVPALADAPREAWRFTFADALSAGGRDVPADPVGLGAGASIALPAPAAGGQVNTSGIVVVAVNPGSDPAWSGYLRGVKSLGTGGTTTPVTSAIVAIDVGSGEALWARGIVAAREQPCQQLGRGAIVACLTGNDPVSVSLVHATTGEPYLNFFPRRCSPEQLLRDGGRFYWAGRGPEGVCLGGGTSGRVLGLIPGETTLEQDALTLTARGPVLRTTSGSLARVDGEWRGFEGWVEPGPEGMVVQSVGASLVAEGEAREGDDTASATSRVTPVTTVTTTGGTLLHAVEGPLWRRLDLAFDAEPSPPLAGLVGSGTAARTLTGRAQVSLASLDDDALSAGAGVVVTPVSITTSGADGDGSATWSLTGALDRTAAGASVVVGATGRSEFRIETAAAAGWVGGEEFRLVRADRDLGDVWTTGTVVDPGTATAPRHASSSTTAYTLVGDGVVVRQRDGVAAFR